jgi:hypothetical protein
MAVSAAAVFTNAHSVSYVLYAASTKRGRTETNQKQTGIGRFASFVNNFTWKKYTDTLWAPKSQPSCTGPSS